MKKHEYPLLGETLYTDTLPNGLRLCVVPKPGFRSFFAAFATHYGGAHRRFRLEGRTLDTPAGVAHYLEHKMFDLPGGDNALGILTANGADPNAFTSAGMTCYYFQCSRGFEENLRMLLHFVSTPYFTEETVQKERGIIAQEIRMGEDSPGNAVYYDLLKLLYDHHPIRDQVAGTVESIAQITHETLYDCHRVFYAPSNMCLCVEGDLDPKTVRDTALKFLPREKAETPQADFGAPEGPLPCAALSRRTMEVSAPQFLIGAKVPPERNGEAALRQRLTARLALRLLLGSSSPFYTRLYTQGLLNRDYDYDVDFTAGTGTLIIGGESQAPERVLDALRAEVGRVSRDGFDEKAFQRARRASYGARLRGLEDFDSVCISLAEGVFNGFCALDAPVLLQEIGKAQCEAFVREFLADERLAMAIVEAKKV